MAAAEIFREISTILTGRRFLISSPLAEQAGVSAARLPRGIAATDAYIPSK